LHKIIRTICEFIFIDWTNSKHEEGGGNSAVENRKLNYRFHNPNPADATADYILKVLIEANITKVERSMKEAAKRVDEADKIDYEQ
jgi:hypothetical protein